MNKRQCVGKVPYAERKQAVAAMMRVKRQTNSVQAFRVYQCGVCKKFHWGHAKGMKH